MIPTQFKVSAILLLWSVSVAVSPTLNQTTALSECRLDVNQKNDAFRQLKKIKSFNDGYTEGPTFYDVRDIKPFGFAAIQFSSDLFGMHPRYSYEYDTFIDAKFATAKTAMLKSYGKSKCDVSKSQGSASLCEISTGLPTKNTASGPRGSTYRPKLILLGDERQVVLRCKYSPAE